MDWLNITMKTTTELFVTAYNIILRRIPYYVWSFCGSPGGPRLFKRPLGRSLSSRKVLGKLIHWIEIYPVDNSIHVLNNWGQAVTYKNVKKLCFLNNDWNNDKYELNDVNDKNNIIIIFVVIIIRIVIIIIIIVIVIIIYFYSSNLIFYNPLHLHICWFATPNY